MDAPCQLGVRELRGGIRGPPEDADDGVDAEREDVPESRRHSIRLPLLVERVRNLEPHLVTDPRHRDHHRDGQRAESVASVQSHSFAFALIRSTRKARGSAEVRCGHTWVLRGAKTVTRRIPMYTRSITRCVHGI